VASIPPTASQPVAAALAALSGQTSDGGRRGTPTSAGAQYRKKATTDSRSGRFNVIALDAPRGQQVDVKV
jgi:hypothetical protein